jgi:hypothetical protein
MNKSQSKIKVTINLTIGGLDMNQKLKLKLLNNIYGVCRLEHTEPIPEWATRDQYFSITKTPEELSIVCAEKNIPERIRYEGNWRQFKVEGILDFSLVGILSSLATLMAQNDISIFVISTFNTDYILVKNSNVNKAVDIFKENGCSVIHNIGDDYVDQQNY